MKKKMVYVASPVKGDLLVNMERAKVYCRYAIMQGVIPVLPHLMYLGSLNDEDPLERDIGMGLGVQLLRMCNELWVFGQLISEGMLAEIEVAKQIGIPIQYIKEI